LAFFDFFDFFFLPGAVATAAATAAATGSSRFRLPGVDIFGAEFWGLKIYLQL